MLTRAWWRRSWHPSLRRLRRPWVLVLALGMWTLLVLYPNPYRLAVSLYRIAYTPSDAAAMAQVAAQLPRDPLAVEHYVTGAFPYRTDWETSGVPWYYPTVAEALARGAGDCKTQFVVLASLFDAQGTPYRKHYSITHFWVSYAGKQMQGIEDPTSALFVRDPAGRGRWQWANWGAARVGDTFRANFWDPMPSARKAALFGGWLLLGVLALSGRRRSGAYRSGYVGDDGERRGALWRSVGRRCASSGHNRSSTASN